MDKRTLMGTLKAWARTIKRDAHVLYLAARDPRVPWYVKALALFVAGYALSPIDLIPDFIPAIGLLDDAVLVPVGILIVIRLIPPQVVAEHRATAAAAAQRPVSRLAAVVVAIVWGLGVAACAWFAYRHVAG
ncbi:membrane protein [Pandoraea anhela]|uniref:Membrane protein n=1 Tax=Pandoraea anhela TaxID=2508295 RepID=A0A5E4X8D8_9BURK|nr:membrane protein [Pandoraea anhela]